MFKNIDTFSWKTEDDILKDRKQKLEQGLGSLNYNMTCSNILNIQ